MPNIDPEALKNEVRAYTDQVRVEPRAKDVRGSIADAIDHMAAVLGREINQKFKEVDKTLTQPDQGADAAIVGKRFSFNESQIEKLNKSINGITVLDYDLIVGAGVLYLTGVLTDNNTLAHTDFVELPEGSKNVLYTRMKTSASSSSTGMAFYDDEQQYISGQQRIVNSPDGYGAVLDNVEVPVGAKYARFTYITPDYYSYYPPFYIAVDNLSDVSFRERLGIVEDDSINTKNAVFDFNKQLSTDLTDGYSIYWRNVGGEAIGGRAFSSPSLACSDYIEIPKNSLKIHFMRILTTLESTNSGMAFYDINKNFLVGIPNGTQASAAGAELYTTRVPDNAVYARFSYVNSEFRSLYPNIYPEFYVSCDVSRISELEKRIDQIDIHDEWNALGLHMRPESDGVVNLIKRCRQFTDIEWTPAVDLPRHCYVTRYDRGEDNIPKYNLDPDLFEGVFKAGVKYKGIPYGQCLADYKGAEYGLTDTYIGMTIPFETFMSSVSNKDSMLCKESEYGPGQGNYHSTVYAVVCSALTSYALGLSELRNSAQIATIPGIESKGRVNQIDLSIVKLGDVVNLSGSHSMIVTDCIIQNNDLKFIEISEATVVGNGNQDIPDGLQGGICRRVWWSKADFVRIYGEYSILRYAYVNTISYMENPYVDVGDGIKLYHYDNYPCMPYEGVGFPYKLSKTSSVKILIAVSGYNTLRVFRAGEVVDDYAITDEITYIDVPISSAGDYAAILCTKEDNVLTARSMSCYWTVML